MSHLQPSTNIHCLKSVVRRHRIGISAHNRVDSPWNTFSKEASPPRQDGVPSGGFSSFVFKELNCISTSINCRNILWRLNSGRLRDLESGDLLVETGKLDSPLTRTLQFAPQLQWDTLAVIEVRPVEGSQRMKVC